MIAVFLKLAALLDRLTRAVCMGAALLLTASVLIIVILRYGFGIGFIQLQDFAAYAFAVLMVLCVPVAMAQNAHVRVEVLSERLPPQYLRCIDGLALLLFLLPVFGLIIWAWWPDLRYAWHIGERSVETGGLGGLYLVKTALPLAAGLMMVQGIAVLLLGAQRSKNQADSLS